MLTVKRTKHVSFRGTSFFLETYPVVDPLVGLDAGFMWMSCHLLVELICRSVPTCCWIERFRCREGFIGCKDMKAELALNTKMRVGFMGEGSQV